MPLEFSIARLREAITSIFEIDTIGLKDDSGKLSVRDEDDTVFIDVAASGFEIQDNAGNRIKLLPPSLTGDVDLTLPVDDGNNGDVLQTDGNGGLSFVAPMAAGDIDLDDLGDVDVAGPTDGDFLRYDNGSGNWIDATAAISDLSDANTAGVSDGDFLRYNNGAGEWQDSTAAIDDLSDVAITTPADGEVLVYNAGTWENVDANTIGNEESIRTFRFDFNQGTASPSTLFTPPANAIIRLVVVRVDTAAAAAGAAPTIEIGTSGDPDAYLEANDSNLERQRLFSRFGYSDAVGAPDAITATITPQGKTFSGVVFVEYFVPAT